MLKGDLVKLVANDVNMTQKDVTEVINSATKTITDALVNGEKVTISGFASFNTREVPEHSGEYNFNGREGEKFCSPAHRVAVIRPLSGLKSAVRDI